MRIFHTAAMDTDIFTAGLNAVDAAAVFADFEEMERKFSRFSSTSELSHVNSSPEKEIGVSDIFMQVIEIACFFYKETGGIFSPFLGLQMKQIGYGNSFEQLIDVETDKIYDAYKNLPAGIVLNDEQKTVRIYRGIALDLGGIVKGWCAQKNALQLMVKAIPMGLINAGGDIFAWNDSAAEHSWHIDITDPYDEGKKLLRLALKINEGVGVATSSRVKRSWQGKNGQIYHHIIDPRTGTCADSDCIQATVVGNSLLLGEIYAKCLLIIGIKNGTKWLRRHHPDAAFIMVDLTGKIIVSDNLAAYCSY